MVLFNGARWIERSIDSVQDSDYQPIEIIVVDNGSSDDGVDLVRRRFPDVRLIDLSRNYGFAEANNRARLLARGDYIFLLNQDARVERDCIGRLVEAAEKDPKTGIWAPKLLYDGEDRVINSTGIRANEGLWGWDRNCFELDVEAGDPDAEILAACGAAAFIRSDLMGKIGFFDSRFFMYYEDMDLGIRCWLSGHPVRYLPASVAYHDMRPGGRSPLFGAYFDLRNRIRTILKNFRWKTALPILSRMLYFHTKLVGRDLMRKERRHAWLQVRAVLWNIFRLGETLRERKRVWEKFVTGEEQVIRFFQKGVGYPRLSHPVPDYPVRFEKDVFPDSVGTEISLGNNDASHLGFGWFNPEERNGEPCRWTGLFATLYLRNPHAGGCDRSLAIKVCSEQRAGLQVSVNQRVVGNFNVDSRSWETARFTIDDESLLLRIDISVTTHSERNAKSGKDERIVGVCVSSVRVDVGQMD